MAVVAAALLQLRGVSTVNYFRAAAAPAPGGGLYYADIASNRVYLISASGGRAALGQLPGYTPLSMAVRGSWMVVGSELALYQSFDGGRHFARPRGVRGLHFTAVDIRSTDALAADWGGALWVTHDSGETWKRADAPAADLQVNAVLIGRGAWFAATETGLLRSRDGGESWTKVGEMPDRLTSLFSLGDELLAGTWSGRLLASSDDGSTWERLHSYPSGVWWVDGEDLVATANGLYVDGAKAGPPLSRLEVIQVRRSGAAIYAIQPGPSPPVWVLAGAGGSWRRV